MISSAPKPFGAPAPAEPQNGAYPWMPDQGNGTFRNPILYADYSDPDVIRHNDDFFLTASSFNCAPGLPILHSRDLVNWTIINHALKSLPHPRYAEVQPGCGVWAPALRFHAGKFWIFFPMPDEGIYVVTAEDPAGEWSEAHLLQEGKGLIDPCPLWDDDGRAYLVHAYARSRAGIRDRLRVCPMSPDGRRLLGEGEIVFHDPARQPILEGPKFMKRDGWYYILAPAGGVENGWQTVLRSRKIYGPYEDKIVLQQGNTAINGPHQGALVDTPSGEWWFVHFQDRGVYGRITHLQPVAWRDHWPMMGRLDGRNGPGEPVLVHAKPSGCPAVVPAVPQTSDEFDAPVLGRQWQWQANPRADWCQVVSEKSRLRLYAHPIRSDLMGAPNLLLQKFPASAFVCETRLEFSPAQPGEEAGLVITGHSWTSLALRNGAGGRELVWSVNGVERYARSGFANALKLRIAVGHGGVCTFFVATGEEPFTRIPGEFQALRGNWTGAKIGIYAVGRQAGGPVGYADFDYCRFA